MHSITVKSSRNTEFIDITEEVDQVVRESGVESGICYVFAPHTTAGITVNENADPSVKDDIVNTLDRLVPQDGRYSHMEGNAAAHIKASVVGASQSLPIVNGRLSLGTWQGIYLCEFDGPRTRRVVIQPIRSET